LISDLLFCGVIGPLLFVVVFAIEGALRPGYRPRRHFVSSLARGSRGWIQVANFLMCGVLMLLFAVGLFCGVTPELRGEAVPVLFVLFGLGLIVAGVFRTDVAASDTAASYVASAAAPATLRGLVHGLSSLVVFGSLTAAAFVWAWRSWREGDLLWSVYSGLTGFVVFVFFMGCSALVRREINGEISDAPIGLCQRLSIIPGWVWIALVAAHLIRRG
jgi:hypothetical membrane protein